MSRPGSGRATTATSRGIFSNDSVSAAWRRGGLGGGGGEQPNAQRKAGGGEVWVRSGPPPPPQAQCPPARRLAGAARGPPHLPRHDREGRHLVCRRGHFGHAGDRG